MSAERDAGFAALQNGNVAEAIPYLERAVAAAPEEFQTLLHLGAAYGQTGRHADAVRTVMQAVTLQPSNAAARYSLAVAYANAGHQEYAMTAAQQALQLQPDDPRAQELVARLSGAPAAPNSPGGSQSYSQTAAPLSYEQAAPPNATRQPAAPTPYGQPSAPSPYGQAQPPSAPNPSPYGQPGPTPPPLQPQAGSYNPGQTAPPSGMPGAAPYPPQMGAGSSYQGQGAAAYGGSPAATYYTPPPRPGVVQIPDKFDMKQAVRDWVRVLREPHAFFREQAERDGFNAPLAFLVTFGIGVGILTLLTVMIRLVIEPSSTANTMAQMGVGIFGFVGGITGALMGAFVWGGVLHLVGRLFGNRQPYQKSFRVAAYSRAPLLFFTALTALITPFLIPSSAFTPSTPGAPSPFGQMTPVQFTEPPTTGFPGRRTYSTPGGMSRPRYGGTSAPNPFDSPAMKKLMQAYIIIGPITLVGMIWVWCLQAIGLRYAQNLSPGSAAGTVFLALLLPFLLLIALGVVFGLIIAAAIGASHRSPSFTGVLSLIRPGLAVWRGY